MHCDTVLSSSSILWISASSNLTSIFLTFWLSLELAWNFLIKFRAGDTDCLLMVPFTKFTYLSWCWPVGMAAMLIGVGASAFGYVNGVVWYITVELQLTADGGFDWEACFFYKIVGLQFTDAFSPALRAFTYDGWFWDFYHSILLSTYYSLESAIGLLFFNFGLYNWSNFTITCDAGVVVYEEDAAPMAKPMPASYPFDFWYCDEIIDVCASKNLLSLKLLVIGLLSVAYLSFPVVPVGPFIVPVNSLAWKLYRLSEHSRPLGIFLFKNGKLLLSALEF